MTTTSHSASANPATVALFLAWLVALTATLGALFVGEVMGRTPCLLCWYQRIAMFPMTLMLGVAFYTGDLGVRRYALPIAFLGAVAALWHSLLYSGIVAEAIQPCSQHGPSCTGADQLLFGRVPLPLLSLAAFIVIIVLQLIPAKKPSP